MDNKPELASRKLSPHYAPEREDRVAAALRENLRKRKAQQAEKQEKTEDKTCP